MRARRTMADSMGSKLTREQEAFLRKNKGESLPAKKQEDKKTPTETFSVRIPSAVASGIRRVVMKRKLAGEEDLTQQDVVSEVLAQWLRSKGEAA
jgi:hypothetical protein